MVRRTPRSVLRALVTTSVVTVAAAGLPLLSAPDGAHAVTAAVPGTVTPAEPVLQPALVRRLADAPTAPTRVMVQAGGDVARAERAALAAGLRPGVSLDRVGIAVATGTPAQVRALADTPGVTRLDWADEPVALAGTRDHEATRATEVHAGAVDVDGDGRKDRFTGRGFSVAVVDSGTDGTHPMFADGDGGSRVKRNMKVACHDVVGILTDFEAVDDCVLDQTLVNDTDTTALGGHGTHVSGIAAGGLVTDRTGRRIRGSAPDADLIAVSGGATLSIYGGTTGLYWVLLHHADPCGDGSCPPIVAVNNSWGPSGGSAFSATAPNALVQRELVKAGVVVVWAAGNDGGDGSASVTNGPGADPTPGVMMVANYDDAGVGSRDNDLDSSSSRGLKGAVATFPDLAAPGANITSACRPYLAVCATGLDTADPDYNTISGTSMAAPHIAGYVAVLQQAALASRGRLLTPGEVEDVLVDTAHPFGKRDWLADTRNPDSTTGTSFDAGHGLVDMVAAVARVTGRTASAPVVATCPTDARFTDPAGDANSFVGASTPTPSVDALDILAGSLSTSGTGTSTRVTFTVKVKDLPASPGGTAGQDEVFDLNFTLGGAGYYLQATRTSGSPSFVLGRFATQRQTLATGLPGTFDPVADTVTVSLPASVWTTAGLPGSISVGQTVAGLEFVSRRSLVAVVPDADTAKGGCAYTIGG